MKELKRDSLPQMKVLSNLEIILWFLLVMKGIVAQYKAMWPFIMSFFSCILLSSSDK